MRRSVSSSLLVAGLAVLLLAVAAPAARAAYLTVPEAKRALIKSLRFVAERGSLPPLRSYRFYRCARYSPVYVGCYVSVRFANRKPECHRGAARMRYDRLLRSSVLETRFFDAPASRCALPP